MLQSVKWTTAQAIMWAAAISHCKNLITPQWMNRDKVKIESLFEVFWITMIWNLAGSGVDYFTDSNNLCYMMCNKLWSWGLPSPGQITTRTGFNYFYEDWLILPSTMEPIRFSLKCKPSPASLTDVLKNSLDVIQRISISNRPWSVVVYISYIIMCWCCLFCVFCPFWTALCPVLWHPIHCCQFPFVSSLASLSHHSSLSFFLLLSFACFLSQFPQITPMPGNPSHVSYINFNLLHQAVCSANIHPA